MRWPPPIEDKAAWSAAGGVVTIVMAGLAATSPLWPLWGLLALVGFYFTLAPLLRKWPWHKPLTAQETWFQERIEAAARIKRERVGQPYLGAMHSWDVQNVTELREKWREYARPYMVHPENPRILDGPLSPYTTEEDAAYFERRVDWLRATLEELREGGKP